MKTIAGALFVCAGCATFTVWPGIVPGKYHEVWTRDVDETAGCDPTISVHYEIGESRAYGLPWSYCDGAVERTGVQTWRLDYTCPMGGSMGGSSSMTTRGEMTWSDDGLHGRGWRVVTATWNTGQTCSSRYAVVAELENPASRATE